MIKGLPRMATYGRVPLPLCSVTMLSRGASRYLKGRGVVAGRLVAFCIAQVDRITAPACPLLALLRK
jgi:hypothetical protein